MRTTIRLDDGLLTQAKREAARRGETLTSLIEKGLRLTLAQPQSPQARPFRPPVSSVGGGTLPGVDLNDSAAVLDILEGHR